MNEGTGSKVADSLRFVETSMTKSWFYIGDSEQVVGLKAVNFSPLFSMIWAISTNWSELFTSTSIVVSPCTELAMVPVGSRICPFWAKIDWFSSACSRLAWRFKSRIASMNNLSSGCNGKHLAHDGRFGEINSGYQIIIVRWEFRFLTFPFLVCRWTIFQI